jgi:hypothetical protein
VEERRRNDRSNGREGQYGDPTIAHRGAYRQVTPHL